MNNSIEMNGLAYSFDNAGNVTRVDVSFTGANLDEGGSYVSATVRMLQADLPSGKTFDDMTKSDYEAAARSKLSALVAQPATTPTQPASVPDTASTPAK